MPGRFSSLRVRLCAAEDAAALLFVRSCFGLVIAWHALHYLLTDRVGRLYLEPPFHFRYLFFEWVEPLPGPWLYVAHVLLGISGLCLMLGWRPRWAAASIAVLWAYFFLLEQARYLNHAYLIGLLAFLFACIPTRQGCVPRWGLWLLRIQIGIPYFFGGIAKFEPDWLQAMPARLWLAERQDLLLVGWMQDFAWAPYLFAYAALLFDLLIVPLLLWPRSRMAAFPFALFFHLANAQLFDIGVFPWLMIAATTIYFDPSWPRRWRRNREPLQRTPIILPRWGLLALACYLALQVLLPFRHWLYPGRTAWTEEGHSFAWRMMLRSKDGTAQFEVYDPQQQLFEIVDPAAVLPAWQVDKMVCRPDLLHQFARWLREQRGGNVQVRAVTLCSLNGRPPQPLIDPAIDLAAQPRSLAPASWILPLRNAPDDDLQH